jgi:hypothetical protein
VPSPRNQNPNNRRFDWPGILRILLVQVLAALMIAFVRYVNWSSDQAWAEFSRAVTVPAPDAKPEPQSAAPMRAVKNRIPCARRG